MMEFVECDTCRAKPGSPRLCDGCLSNRKVIGDLREALKFIFDTSTKRRMDAALADAMTLTPYADTASEKFCYWRGVREGLGFINAVAHDVLNGLSLKELTYVKVHRPRDGSEESDQHVRE